MMHPFAPGSRALLLALFAALPVFAQNGRITGRVTDAATGEPLVAANVSMIGTSTGAATDRDGRFNIVSLPAGLYTLSISRIGYRPIQRRARVVGDSTLVVDVALESQVLEIPELVVERDRLVGNRDQVYAIPGSAHYLGPEALRRHQASDANRLLAEIPGVNLQEEDGYGLRPNIGLRGSGSERSQKITLMEDGILIAPAPYAAPAAYYFPTIGRMQGVEVRKGASQIKYGPYTTAGALNLISAPIPEKLQVGAKVVTGSDHARTLHATLGDSRRHFGFVAEVYRDGVDGFKRLDGGGNTGFEKTDYMLKFRFNSDRRAPLYHELSFKFNRVDEVANETYLGLTEADFAAKPLRRYAGSQQDVFKAEHNLLQLRYFLRLSSRFDITTSLYRSDFGRNWYKLDKVQPAAGADAVKIGAILEAPQTYAEEYAIIAGRRDSQGGLLWVKANNRQYKAQGVQSVAAGQFTLAGTWNQIEVGLRYHTDAMDRFQWVDGYGMQQARMALEVAGTPGTESNRIESARAWAAFIEHRITAGRLTVVPGLRFESIQLQRRDYGTADPERTGRNLKTRQNRVQVWIPGIGLSYDFTAAVGAFSGIHKGFAPPGSREDTRPEESVNFEAGLRLRPGALAVQVVAFLNDYSNLLGADLAASGGDGSGDLYNGGAATVQGFELSASYAWQARVARWPLQLPLRLAYTWTDGRFGSTFASDFEPWGKVQAGDELPYVARHQLAVGFGVHGPALRFDGSARYVSAMRTEAGRGAFDPHKSTDAALVLDVTLAYRFSVTSSAFVSVRNLGNRIYLVARRPAGLRPGLPRTFLAGVEVGLGK